MALSCFAKSYSLRAEKCQPESGRSPPAQPVMQCRMKSLKFFSKIAVLFDHLPESEHARLADPVLEILAGDGFHLRPTAPDETKIGIGAAQCVHQGRAVVVRTRLTRDEVNRFQRK